ncbi:MAG: S24/S26 family peptidase [Bdellovibrionaceae bacterium]|nr:S24/S26 family peptidase [Pseudobdellovibrionaceae bacterium]
MLSSDWVTIPINGQSMWPTLRSGQKLLVEINNGSTVLKKSDVGELFIFKDGPEWVCHRYLGKHNEQYVFKGDYSTTCDVLTSPHILGRVFGIERHREQYYAFTKSSLDSLIVVLQIKSVFAPLSLRRVFRHAALLLMLFKKPFLYKKISPTKIIG